MQKNEMNEECAVQDERMHTLVIEGRNAVLEAFRSGKPIDKVFVLDGCQDGPVRTIVREAVSYTHLDVYKRQRKDWDLPEAVRESPHRQSACWKKRPITAAMM